MICNQCKQSETRVLESRTLKEGDTVRRRRECTSCGNRFTTFERIEQINVMVVKRDGARESFDREKLLRSMVLACRKRSVNVKDLENIAEWVERFAAATPEREISASRIGELVLDVLRHLDPVAYVRFASVYRAFVSPEDFIQELKQLSKGGKHKVTPVEKVTVG